MWRALPFKSKNLEKGIATRKKTEVNLIETFFPPEGHCNAQIDYVNEDEGS